MKIKKESPHGSHFHLIHTKQHDSSFNETFAVQKMSFLHQSGHLKIKKQKKNVRLVSWQQLEKVSYLCEDGQSSKLNSGPNPQ